VSAAPRQARVSAALVAQSPSQAASAAQPRLPQAAQAPQSRSLAVLVALRLVQAPAA
jgi:hypothetical protein